MNPVRNRQLSRRLVLKGVGVSLALPWLDAMLPALASARTVANASPKPRMVFLYVPNGVNIGKWVPGRSGRGANRSETLEVLLRRKSDFSVLSGLGHPNSKGGHSGADTWLTGADLAGTPGYDYRNSISVDQVAAEVVGLETRIPSLELSSQGGTGSPGHSHTLAFSRNAVPIPAEDNPRAVFERLFVEDSGATKKSRTQRFQEDRSILDLVTNQAKDLNRKLGTRDQRKLDEYLTSVREVERRVARLEGWVDVPKPQVDPDQEGLNLNSEPGTRGDRASYFDTMLDLIALAFEADITRVCTFEMGREAGGGDYSELGLNANHHELSHHGGDREMLDGLFKIDRFLLERVAGFLDRLKGTEGPEASLLDQTLIMYGSGMNSGAGGGHSPKNLPLITAGGRGLGLTQGQHLAFDEDSTPLANLFVTFLQAMGLEFDSFADSTGTLTGLS